MSASLFSLILNLSAPEQRYIQLYLNPEKAEPLPKYQQLFDTIRQMKHWSSDTLKQQLPWASDTRKYVMVRRYLFDRILDLLLAFRSQTEPRKDLKKRINRIYILNDRGMVEETLKRVREAIKLAKRYALFHEYYELLDLKRSILVHKKNQIFSATEFIELQEEIGHVLKAIHLDNQLKEFRYQYFAQTHHSLNLPGTKFSLPTLQAIEKEMQELPYVVLKANYFNALNQFHYLNGSFQESLNSLINLVELLKHETSFRNQHLAFYIASIHNLINRGMRVHQYSKILPYLVELRTFRPDQPRAEQTRLESFFSLALALTINSGFIEENRHILAEFEPILESENPPISKRMALAGIYLTSGIYFLSGNHSKALKWLDKMHTHLSRNEFQNFVRPAGLYRILIYLELDYVELLEYEVRNQMSRTPKSDLHPFEISFFAMAREFLDGEGRNQYLKAFADLTTAEDQNYDFLAFTSFFDFESWAQARLRGVNVLTYKRAKWLDNGYPPMVIE